MKLEEAIAKAKILNDSLKELTDEYEGQGSFIAAGMAVSFKLVLDTILSALRPVSREQVEKVWPGCEFCNRADFGEFGFEITKHYAKISCALGSWRFPKGEQFLFCPKCGKPLTDEAVEMVMERLEELKDAGD